MRDEQFEAHGIERKNKARVAKEQTAKTQRAQAPVQSRRADTSQPAFTSNRSSHGGGSRAFSARKCRGSSKQHTENPIALHKFSLRF